MGGLGSVGGLGVCGRHGECGWPGEVWAAWGVWVNPDLGECGRSGGVWAAWRNVGGLGSVGVCSGVGWVAVGINGEGSGEGACPGITTRHKLTVVLADPAATHTHTQPGETYRLQKSSAVYREATD